MSFDFLLQSKDSHAALNRLFHIYENLLLFRFETSLLGMYTLYQEMSDSPDSRSPASHCPCDAAAVVSAPIPSSSKELQVSSESIVRANGSPVCVTFSLLSQMVSIPVLISLVTRCPISQPLLCGSSSHVYGGSLAGYEVIQYVLLHRHMLPLVNQLSYLGKML